LFLLAGETGYIDAFKKGGIHLREYADFLEPTDDGLYYPEKSLLVGISNEGEVLLTKTGAHCTTSCFSDGSVVKKVPIDFVNRAEVVRLSLTQETYLATCGLKGIHLFEIDGVTGTASLVSQLSNSGCFALTSIPWEDVLVVIDDTANVIVYEVVEGVNFDSMDFQYRTAKRVSGGTGGSTTGTTGTSATSGTMATTGEITGTTSATSTTGTSGGSTAITQSSESSPKLVVTQDGATKILTLIWENNSGQDLVVTYFKVKSGPCVVSFQFPLDGEILEPQTQFQGNLNSTVLPIGVYVCLAELFVELVTDLRQTVTSYTVDYDVTIIVTGANLKIATRSTLTLTEQVILGVISNEVVGI